MNEYKAIPQGYMTVGEVARKMGVTVRTLQYYDKEGLFSPSAESGGGRRLYTDRDLVKLYQLLSLKSLGFSLDDIKSRLTSLDTPEEVADEFTQQAAAIREKLNSLSESLKQIEALKEEVLQMKSVDFKKYADIITNLKMKNEFYRLIKHFDERTLEFFHNRFDNESGPQMMKKITGLFEEAVRLQSRGVTPDSGLGQKYAAEFWQMIMEFTKGDMSMLPELMRINQVGGAEGGWQKMQEVLQSFVEPAIEIYFEALDYDPLEEAETE